MRLRTYFGFGAGDDQKKNKEIDRYNKELEQIRADVKELYKDGINENTDQMKQIDDLCEEAAKLHQASKTGDALLRLAGTVPLVKQARKALKDQKAYVKEARKAKAAVVALSRVYESPKELSELATLQGLLKEAGDLSGEAKYPQARQKLAKINELADGGKVPRDREAYVKQRDYVAGSIRALKVIGFTGTDAEVADLEKMLANAKDKASRGEFSAALHEIDGAKAIMTRADVVAKRDGAQTDLQSGNFLQAATEEEWANAVIDLFNLHPRFEKGDFHDLDIPIKIGPRDYLKYKKLQENIAAQGLEEYQRPTINLTVRGAHAGNSSFGIVGGTGPLSDAEMLTKTMENLEHQKVNDAGQEKNFDLDAVHIRLLSAPPPRKNDDDAPQTKKFRKAATRMVAFCSEPHSKMALASNTAHMNLTGVRAFRGANIGGLRPSAGKVLESHQVQDLAGGVVKKILHDPALNGRKPKPIVLGTKAAYDGEMYKKRFGKKVPTAEVEPKESVRLQAYIDDAKRGLTDAALTKKVQEFIIKELAKHPDATHIILGCTELPLALGGHEKIHAFEKELNKDRDANNQVHFLDTESFFADRYTSMVAKNAGADLADAPHEAEEEEEEEEESETGETPPGAMTGPEREEWIVYIAEVLQEKLAQAGAQADAGAVNDLAADLCNHAVNDLRPDPNLGKAVGLAPADLDDVYDNVAAAIALAYA